MTRRYKRDRRGRFARTGGVSSASAANAVAAGANLAVGNRTTAALHGAKLGASGARRVTRRVRSRSRNPKTIARVNKVDTVVDQVERAVNIVLLGAYVNNLGGTKVGKQATRGAARKLSKLQQERLIRKNPRLI